MRQDRILIKNSYNLLKVLQLHRNLRPFKPTGGSLLNIEKGTICNAHTQTNAKNETNAFISQRL